MNKTASLLFSFTKLNKQMVCSFATRIHNYQVKMEVSIQQKIMRKIIHRLESGKRKMSPVPSANTLSKTDGEDARTGKRRVSVLNKLFMRHITDMMTSGEIAEIIKGRQLEISQVKVAPNFNVVYVLWLSRGDPHETETEELLLKISGLLRHELSQLKVIGMVPLIQFVKDTQYAKLMEVEHALAKADFGEDYEPTTSSKKLKDELTINTKLSSSVVEKIKHLENQEFPEDELMEEPMPPMRQDVFGLDRNKMMNRLDQSSNKSGSSVFPRLEEDWDYVSATSSMGQNAKLNIYIKEKEISRRKAERIMKNKLQKGESDEVTDLHRKKYLIDESALQDDYEDHYDDFDDDTRK